MAQYTAGSILSVAGNVITGQGTLWLANAAAGNWIDVGQDGILLQIASVDTDTQITTTSAYSGAAVFPTSYAVVRDFTTPDNLPLLNQGDVDAPAILSRLATSSQAALSSIRPVPGTFTPTITLGGASVGATFSNALGKYVQFGTALIHFDILLQLTSKGTSVGNIAIGGLPFLSSAALPGSIITVMAERTTIVAPLYGYLGPNRDYVTLDYVQANVPLGIMTEAHILNNSNFYLSGSYVPA